MHTEMLIFSCIENCRSNALSLVNKLYLCIRVVSCPPQKGSVGDF